MSEWRLSLYTSEEEYRVPTATRTCRAVPTAEVGPEIERFRQEYQTFMDNNSGRLIVVIDPDPKPTRDPLEWALVAEREGWSKPTFTMVEEEVMPEPVQAGIFRAILPGSWTPDGKLRFRLVTTRYFVPSTKPSTLLDWCDEVQLFYGFGPEEVFVMRDARAFLEDPEFKDQQRRPYTKADLSRRLRRQRSEA